MVLQLIRSIGVHKDFGLAGSHGGDREQAQEYRGKPGKNPPFALTRTTTEIGWRTPTLLSSVLKRLYFDTVSNSFQESS